MPAKRPVYLDYAAATPLDSLVLEAMIEASKNFYNPSSIYLKSRDARQKLNGYRARIAKVIGANTEEIILTSGATEANNLALNGITEAYNGKCIVSAIEHAAVLKPLGDKVSIVPVDNRGMVVLEELRRQIDDETCLVSVIYASNEIATVQPISQIANMLIDIRKNRLGRAVKMPLLLHTDASQAIGHLECHVSRLGIDLMTINGAKIYGPKMTGCLYLKAGVELRPSIIGGGQEYGLRAGTESLMNAAGLAEAVELADKFKKSESERQAKLKNLLWQSIKKICPEAIKLGHKTKNVPHILSVRLPGVDNERLVMEMDERGVMLASGSACKASDDEPSSVLKAIGLTDQEAGEVVRFSLGRMTTEREIDLAADALRNCLTSELNNLLAVRKH